MGGAQFVTDSFSDFSGFSVCLLEFLFRIFSFWGGREHKENTCKVDWGGGDGLMSCFWEKVGHQKRRSSNKWMLKFGSSSQKKNGWNPLSSTFPSSSRNLFLLKGRDLIFPAQPPPLRSGGVCSPTTNLIWVHITYIWHKDI